MSPFLRSQGLMVLDSSPTLPATVLQLILSNKSTSFRSNFVATIFAYGQTSSGKTFTMRGITESAVNDIYSHIHNVSVKSILLLLLSE